MAKKPVTIFPSMDDALKALQEESLKRMTKEEQIKYLEMKISEAQRLLSKLRLPEESRSKILAKIPLYKKALSELSNQP